MDTYAYHPISVGKLDRAVRRHFDEDYADGKIIGAQAVVNQSGKRVYEVSLGKHSLGGADMADTKSPMFRIASMTKPVTAAAVLQQYEAGNLDLYAPVSDYLPEYASLTVVDHVGGKLSSCKGRPLEKPLLVYQLLCHSNGIDVLPNEYTAKPGHPRQGLTETASFFAGKPLSFAPLTAVGYSQSGAFDIAARIVELVSGEDYESYLQKHIFAPLGMTDTTFEPSEAQIARFVSIHDRTEDGRAIEAAPTPGCVFFDMPYSCRLAGAGLASTIEDYSKFAEMLLGRGVGDNGVRVLSEESVKLMATPHVPAVVMPGSCRWGLGVLVTTDDGSSLPEGSFGWSGAYGTHFWVDPINKITAIFMRNSLYDSGGAGIIGGRFQNDVMETLYGIN